MNKLLFIGCFCLATTTSLAQQPKKINSSDFINECVRNNGEIPNKQMVLWLPVDFWKIIGVDMKLPDDYVSNVVYEMSKYMVFCVVDYGMSNGQMVFRTADEIRPSLKLIDSAKAISLPLADKDISEKASEIVARLQPALARVLGQFGSGMQIFLFDGRGHNGQPEFDVRTSNRFSLSWDNASMTWRLPFSSVLPPKVCPVDDEPMKGNWDFCPFHGVKLIKS